MSSTSVTSVLWCNRVQLNHLCPTNPVIGKMKPIQHRCIASYVDQQHTMVDRLRPPEIRVSQTYRMIWNCSWGWVQKLFQLEYFTKEEQQWAKLCYFPILEADSSFMCPVLIDRSQKKKKKKRNCCKNMKVQLNLYNTFPLENWHDKHDRNFQRGWYFISIEVQILFHLIQKDANGEKG